ncbi:FtsH protease activity modulator HflK [Gimesia chilikensis]|uniref:FtsH protease activity modulator HflK n=1 Tax=Gimesia chilikensis TaxID=2605989 RepID=UPI0011EBD642|nr:FtsH protease activity modulator HflK [Gimesia chilikensis]KAA0131537.1 FtsH protease activity modulator HflK [Gimesia chilikensis]
MRHSGERSQFDEWLADIDVSHVMWIILFVILGLIIAWGIFTSYYTVQPEGQAVVKRFGKVIAIKDPGLHFKLPFGIDEQEFVPTARVLKQEFGFRTAAQEGTSAVYRKSEEHRDESLMLTGDLKVVDVEWVVQYRVDDPDKYLHRVEQVDKTIRDISEAVMRRIVGNNLGSDVLTIKRVEIALNAKEEIQRLLDSFDMGVRIGTVELQDVNPPDSVKPAFNEVNQAEQEKEQLINEAEKKQNQQIPAARGKAKQVVATAEGYRAERVNGALGETSRFKAILKEYKVAPEVTRRRMYLETLDKVLPSLGKIYVIEPGDQSPIPLLNLDKSVPAQNR